MSSLGTLRVKQAAMLMMTLQVRNTKLYLGGDHEQLFSGGCFNWDQFAVWAILFGLYCTEKLI